jgi:hypothetical protein
MKSAAEASRAVTARFSQEASRQLVAPFLGQPPVQGCIASVRLDFTDAQVLHETPLAEVRERALDHVGTLTKHGRNLLIAQPDAAPQQLEDRPIHLG